MNGGGESGAKRPISHASHAPPLIRLRHCHATASPAVSCGALGVGNKASTSARLMKSLSRFTIHCLGAHGSTSIFARSSFMSMLSSIVAGGVGEGSASLIDQCWRKFDVCIPHLMRFCERSQRPLQRLDTGAVTVGLGAAIQNLGFLR